MQDIDALTTELSLRHANLFFKTPRETFEREAEDLKSRVPALTDPQIVAGLMRLAARADAHTAISPFSYAGFRRLPVRLKFFDDGLFVSATASAWTELLGGRVVRIGEEDVSSVLAKVALVVSHDNEAWLRAIEPGYLTVPELLQAQGAGNDASRVSLTVAFADGSSRVADLPAVAQGQEGVLAEIPSALVPLYRQRSQQNYWATWTQEDFLYVQYNRCQNDPAEPMTAFASRVVGEIDRRSPRAVIVDVRGNTGGNSSVLDPLLSGLRQRSFLAQSGRLFVFIGNTTFSSALLNAISLKRDLRAILVGEATGGKPNSYGEVKTFTLPNSALGVSYSTKFFHVWPEADPDSLYPDIPAPITSTDYLKGRDPALDAVAARLGLTAGVARRATF